MNDSRSEAMHFVSTNEEISTKINLRAGNIYILNHGHLLDLIVINRPRIFMQDHAFGILQLYNLKR